MRTILFFMISLSLNISVLAQLPKPHLSFENEVYDFGTFKEEDGIQAYQFKFKNTGKTPLVISDIKASCGCTTPEWSKAPIAGGKTGFIKVTFDPKSRPGVFNKTITVISNSDEPSKVLKIKGKVTPKKRTTEDNYPHKAGVLRLKNNHIAITRIAHNAKKTADIVIFNPTDKPSTVVFDKIPKHLALSQKKVLIPAKKEVSVTVTYDAKLKKDWGFLTDMIYMIVDGQRKNNILRVSAEIYEDFSNLTELQKLNAPRIQMDSKMVDMGEIKAGEIKKLQFKISNVGKSDLVIRKIKASCGCAATKLSNNTIKPGESEVLNVNFNSKGLSGKQMKTISVISNDFKQSKTVLRLKGLVN